MGNGLKMGETGIKMAETAPNLRNPFVPNLDQWLPTEELLILLRNKALRTRDKVELICAFYAIDHRGQHPYPTEIAGILGVSIRRVENTQTQLIAEGRAERKHGKFLLKQGNYTNPVVARLLSELQIPAGVVSPIG